MRLLIATILGVLALAPPAGAKYLHLIEARPAAEQFAQIDSDESTYAVTAGSCWHAGPHVVQCTMIENARYSGIFEHVLVVALRGDDLYGHLLGAVDAPLKLPRFLRRL